jgi:hypothetical protein
MRKTSFVLISLRSEAYLRLKLQSLTRMWFYAMGKTAFVRRLAAHWRVVDCNLSSLLAVDFELGVSRVKVAKRGSL